jgi:hypothetical protein
MSSSARIIVSPGIYSQEIDISQVSQSIGVTTLGISGEAPKGPAFEPVFVKNFGDYTTFFGGLDPSKYPALPSLPKYEMGYIAKEYLKQSNQLFVTRVLGLSGYNAGKAWGIKVYGNIDWSTLVSQSTVTTSGWQVYVNGSDVKLSNPSVPVFASGGTFDLNGVTMYSTNGTGGNNLVTINDISSPATITASTKSQTTDCTFFVITGLLTTNLTAGTATLTSQSVFSASCQSQYDKLVVAMLRSRVTTTADYDIKQDLHYLVRNDATPATLNNIFFTDIDSINDPYGDFILSGYTKGTSPAYFEYHVNLNKSTKSYLPKAIGGAGIQQTCVFCEGPKSKHEPIWVEEIYPTVYDYLVQYEKIYGVAGISRIDTDLTNYGYKDSTGLQPIGFETPSTPWIVSELRGNNSVDRLFKFQLISDGEMANVDVKISFMNINLGSGEFDVIIRDYNDTDTKLSVLETYQKCNLDPTSNNYIAKKIGTADGQNTLNSRYIMVVMNPIAPVDAVPAGFEGLPMRFDDVQPYGGSAGDLKNVRPVFKTK